MENYNQEKNYNQGKSISGNSTFPWKENAAIFIG